MLSLPPQLEHAQEPEADPCVAFRADAVVEQPIAGEPRAIKRYLATRTPTGRRGFCPKAVSG